VFLMNKRQIVGSVIVFGLLGKDILHGAQIRDGVYKVEVKFMLLLKALCLFLTIMMILHNCV
jgi:hypothetical protein